MPNPKKKRKKKRKGHYIRGTYTSPIAGECKYRSGWELKVMVYLDENPDVESWSYEKTVIEYVSNVRSKKIRKYYPDFLVKYKDGRSELIEVKPKRKLEQLTVKKKMTAAMLWCSERGMSYRIMTEVQLKELGLL
jgi:hypothetical protein